MTEPIRHLIQIPHIEPHHIKSVKCTPKEKSELKFAGDPVHRHKISSIEVEIELYPDGYKIIEEKSPPPPKRIK